MIGKSVLVIAGIIVIIAITLGLYASGIDDRFIDREVGGGGGGVGVSSKIAEVVIKSDSGWSADIKDSQSRSHLVEGFGDRTVPITCNDDDTYSLTVQKSNEGSGTLNVQVVTDGSSSQRSTTTSSNGIISLSGTC
jgi:hypothetical protein